MRHQHVQLLRRIAEEASVSAGQFDEAVEIYEEGDDSFLFRSWLTDESDDGLESSTTATVRIVEYLSTDSVVVTMLSVSVAGEPEVVIEANGSVLFAIMYCGTSPRTKSLKVITSVSFAKSP